MSCIEESRKLFIVPKLNCPDLPNDMNLKKWLVDPESVDELPDSFVVATHWLCDDACPREALGPGCRHIEVSIAKEKRFTADEEHLRPQLLDAGTYQPQAPSQEESSQNSQPEQPATPATPQAVDEKKTTSGKAGRSTEEIPRQEVR